MGLTVGNASNGSITGIQPLKPQLRNRFSLAFRAVALGSIMDACSVCFRNDQWRASELAANVLSYALSDALSTCVCNVNMSLTD